MAHAISLTTVRFEHMSPTAAGMAATLHVLVAAFLLWGTPPKNFEVPEQAIEVTMEEPPAPKAETPPPPPAQPTPPAAQAQPTPSPQPAARPGVPPPPEAKPTEKTNIPLGVRPPSEPTTEPPKQAAAQPPPPQPQQKETPPPEPAPAPEAKLPAIEAPPAPLSMQDFVRAAPPPPPQEIVRPQPRVQPAPPPATPTVQQQTPPHYAPSPLSHPSQQRAPADSQATATLVNPAEAAVRSRAADEYVWAIIRKFSQYLPDLREKNEGGTVVMRMVIARDGRLLESSVAKSSGVLALDKGMLEALRAAAPYPPMPAEIPGDRIVFTQPITAKR